MQLDWTGYEPFDAGVAGDLREAPREVAARFFERLMAARPARRPALAGLAARNQIALEPAAVGAWLAAAQDPRSELLAVDLALWLGDRIVAAAPTLRWELFTSHKKATGYQRAVLVGFAKVADRFYYVDVAFMVASWLDLVARRRAARGDFLATIEQVTLRDA